MSEQTEKQVPVYIPVLEGSLLEGRTALITGGTSGIGLASAKAFLKNGAAVIITEINAERVAKTRNELISLNPELYQNRVFSIAMDNAQSELFNDKFAEILAMIGDRKIDILVNNAGIINGNKDTAEDNFDQVLSINLKASYFLTKLLGRYMIDNNIKGNILNLGSSSSLRPAVSPYIITKWGMRSITLGFAKSLIKHGIVVNGLAPGPTATPLLNRHEGQSLDLPTNPSGRYTTAEEIANMAVVLTSSLGKMIVGDMIFITGGAGNITFDDLSYNF